MNSWLDTNYMRLKSNLGNLDLIYASFDGNYGCFDSNYARFDVNYACFDIKNGQNFEYFVFLPQFLIIKYGVLINVFNFN